MVGHCSHCTIMNNRIDLDDLEIGGRIRIDNNDLATIKYIGEIPKHPGVWIGVEWDNPARGKHNGFVNNVQYFETSYPTSGSMIRPAKIARYENIRDAIECRYLFESVLDEELFKETQRQLKASLFEFVPDTSKSLDKERQSKLLTTVSLPNSNISSPGDLAPFVNLNVLDLTASLLRTWHSVADIVRQLPKLEYLDLSRNRLQLPDESDIAVLEQNFRQLKCINLRCCNLQKWANLLYIARLWPNIERIAIAENCISVLSAPNTEQVLKQLRVLDLNGNPLISFDEILKLGNLRTLETLYCISNHIVEVVLPHCASNEHVVIFENLKEINIQANDIDNQISAFNELDKLPSLTHLTITINPKIGFEETYANAIAHISQLTVLNKKIVSPVERRGAEYDIWKRYSAEWVQTNDNVEEREAFLVKHRAYGVIVKKYGSPDHLIPVQIKTSKFVTLNLTNANTNQTIYKRIPRSITISTLQTLITKLLHSNSSDKEPQLKYIDSDNQLEVIMDNLNKTLDYYSIQDGNCVIADWK